jgi:outer membrane protein OmpA-like peptidoglycan-associated protein
VILAAILTFGGCASKKYVQQQVSSLDPSIKEAKTLGEENRERIDAVDKRAQQGISEARAAGDKAMAGVQGLQGTVTKVQASADAANASAAKAIQGVQAANAEIKRVEGRFATINDVYTQSETQSILFTNNSSTLSDQARGTLDRIASSVTGQPSGYMIEVQGYTDSRGSDMYNLGLSQRRAETVQRYLMTKNVPLYRISIVGLGKDNPVADNKTRQGRDQNRRVDIRVLRSTSLRQSN